jgi:hypothetical protein
MGRVERQPGPPINEFWVHPRLGSEMGRSVLAHDLFTHPTWSEPIQLQFAAALSEKQEMGRRAGRRVRKRARANRRQFALKNRWVFAAVALLFVVTGAILLAFNPSISRDNTMFGWGALTVGFVWMCWALIVSSDGQEGFLRGARAEVDTSNALRRLRRHGWSVIDDVEFDGFNVDHVLVGPAGVFAIETKWTTRSWTVRDGALDAGPESRPAQQAQRYGTKVRTLLKHHAGIELDVRPVVVAWGPGRPRLDGVTTVLGDGTWLLEGPRCGEAFADLATVLTEADIVMIVESLRTFTDKRDAYKARSSAPKAALAAG